jgi:hypothetical protein
MDVATPTRGKKKLNTCTRKKDIAFGGTLGKRTLSLDAN